ncbi:MAG TPA: cupin domain-containing protein [Myxococcota bacterium]|nr:cupin domain-containing protein [Myxococcota bacterium]
MRDAQAIQLEIILERVAELIRTLELAPHPEGGYYREIWRAPLGVEPWDDRGTRAALTSIYFLLPAGAVSCWHRVRSDEIWHHYEGAPLELLLVPPDALRLERCQLGPLGREQAPVRCVPAMWWQAAQSLGAYSLVGCTVGPGFQFGDFELLRDRERLADELCRALPAVARFK